VTRNYNILRNDAYKIAIRSYHQRESDCTNRDDVSGGCGMLFFSSVSGNLGLPQGPFGGRAGGLEGWYAGRTWKSFGYGDAIGEGAGPARWNDGLPFGGRKVAVDAYGFEMDMVLIRRFRLRWRRWSGRSIKPSEQPKGDVFFQEGPKARPAGAATKIIAASRTRTSSTVKVASWDPVRLLSKP